MVTKHPGVELLLQWHLRSGPHLRGWLPGQRFAYLLGPEANAFVFGHDHLFRTREAYRLLEHIDGPRSVVISDGDDHVRRRGALRPSLAPRRVDGYLETMASSADEALARTELGVPFDASAVMRSAIRRSTLRALFGAPIADRASQIGDHLQPLLDLGDTVAFETLRRLNSPRWRAAMRARRWIEQFVTAEIERSRTDGPGDDVLSLLVHGPDGRGSTLDDDEIRDQAITVIAAGYETTSAAMSWTIHALGQRPRLMQRARDEVLALDDRPWTPEAITAVPLLSAIVTESLRLHPPAALAARYVVEDFSFAGRAVPAGTLAVISPYVTHRSPAVYDDPLEFQPERWLENRSRPGNEYLPFGGGAHRCLGSRMATVELTVMLARLLRRGPYRLAAQRVTAVSVAAMRPKTGIVITQ